MGTKYNWPAVYTYRQCRFVLYRPNRVIDKYNNIINSIILIIIQLYILNETYLDTSLFKAFYQKS